MWSAKEEWFASDNDKALDVTGKIARAWIGLGGPDMELEEPCQMILALKPPRRETPTGGVASMDWCLRDRSARGRLVGCFAAWG